MSSSQNTIIEPFLDPNNSRQKLYPIQHKDLWEYYKLHK